MIHKKIWVPTITNSLISPAPYDGKAIALWLFIYTDDEDDKYDVDDDNDERHGENRA